MFQIKNADYEIMFHVSTLVKVQSVKTMLPTNQIMYEFFMYLPKKSILKNIVIVIDMNNLPYVHYGTCDYSLCSVTFIGLRAI